VRLLGACSLGGSGHLNPLLAFLMAPSRPGDEVLVAGPPALADAVGAAGLHLWPGGEPPEEMIAPIRDQLALAPPAVASELGNRELFGRLATEAMLPEMRRCFDQWRPDLVLRDPCEYASAVLSKRTGTAVAQVAISFADVEAGSIRVAAPALEDHEPGLVDALFAAPYLTRFPASLDPSEFPGTVRYREPGPAVRTALPDWWPGSDSPLLYVTLGTVLGHMSFAVDVFRGLLAAVRDLDARVLLTTGRHFDVASLGVLPPHVHVEPWVDQADVLSSSALVVCHGGSGTVLGALGAGVPLVIVPSFADQFENARRLEGVGAGRVVATASPTDRRPASITDAPRIADAVREVLGDAAFASRARAIGAEMHAAPLADDVLASLQVA
jgi:UDP:flavonoid glycosyltransferase YjiC (YdhE family)